MFGPVSKKGPLLDLAASRASFVEGVRRISDRADYVLVADVKDPSLLKLSSVHAAVLLHEALGIRAVPVIVARDANRASVTTSIMTALSMGLNALFLVWGDRFSSPGDPKSVYDFRSLSDLIALARGLVGRAGISLTVFAPFSFDAGKRGLALAKDRLAAGADLLLAQPPSGDRSTFRKHLEVLERERLADRVLLGVFPFLGVADVKECARKFSWSLPAGLLKIAEGGESGLASEAREVVRLARQNRLRGVHVSTRGVPERALALLS
jgi:5,10-methylenetetrahydrofolate reductase